MNITKENYEDKKRWADDLHDKVAQYLLARDFGVASLEIVDINDSGEIVDVHDLSFVTKHRGFNKDDLVECFTALNISPLEFREVLKTRFQIRVYEHERRKRDPNCEEYYEDLDLNEDKRLLDESISE